MTEEDLLLTRIDLITLCVDLNKRLMEVKKLRPNQTELHEDLEKLRDMAMNGYKTFMIIEKEWRVQKQRNFDISLKNDVLRLKVKELEEKNSKLLEGL